MRKINTTDVFKAFRLVTKSSLKDELTKTIEGLATNGFESVEKVGINGCWTILETLTDERSENLFYELLSGIYGMSAKQVAALDLETQIKNLTQIYEENNLRSFFTVLSNLLKKKS